MNSETSPTPEKCLKGGTAAIEKPADYFRILSTTAAELPLTILQDICDVLHSAFIEGRAIYLFGNGGSAALASHFACDLGKGTAAVSGNGKRFKVLALTDNIPTITAWANDSHYDNIFAEQLLNWAQPGDVAFAISGSGNSPNVLKALRVAGEADAICVGITGFKGGRMKELCDPCLIVPSDNMQIIEDLHLSVAHCLFTILRNRILATSRSKSLAATAG